MQTSTLRAASDSIAVTIAQSLTKPSGLQAGDKVSFEAEAGRLIISTISRKRYSLQELLAMHGAPLLATTLIPPGESDPLNDPEEIRDRYEKLIAGVIDAGACSREPTTVVDCTGDHIEVVRQGLGDVALLGL